MPQLTNQGRRVLADLASRHGVSSDTVLQLAEALHHSDGAQAQFNLPELGGMGQWQQGGMVMVGDMFNTNLKNRVDALCGDLARALRDHSVFAEEQTVTPTSSTGTSNTGASNTGWPAEFGQPAAQGAQNDMRYALFPQTNRLAVAQNGQITLYDTAGHDISGFGQSQGGGQSLSFSSQHGTMPLSSLPVVTGNDSPAANDASLPDDQIFSRIERLAQLRDKGAVSDAEFAAKKSELLSRL